MHIQIFSIHAYLVRSSCACAFNFLVCPQGGATVRVVVSQLTETEKMEQQQVTGHGTKINAFETVKRYMQP